METGFVGERPAGSGLTLGSLARGERAVVRAVREDGQAVGDAEGSTVARRLVEIGFVPGAPLEVMATMWPGADPIAVRVGGSTFALRRREADAVEVERVAPAGPERPA
jgi:ferrous iron transport protein A